MLTHADPDVLTVHIGCSCCFPVNKVNVSSLQALRSSMVGTTGRGKDSELVQSEQQEASESHLVRLLLLSGEEDQNKASPVKTY